MKMRRFEKLWVNSATRTRQVAKYAEKMLHLVDFADGQKYLDVGCGNGVAPIYLAEKYGLEVTGIDVDPDQIRVAQERSKHLTNLRFMTIDAGKLPFQDDEFHIVATHSVTHHIPNWEDALVEMIRVLKPNGYFLYSDMVTPGWLSSIRKAASRKRISYLTRGALDAFFERNRLSQIYLSRPTLRYETVCRRPG